MSRAASDLDQQGSANKQAGLRSEALGIRGSEPQTPSPISPTASSPLRALPRIVNGHVQTGWSQSNTPFGASEQPPDAFEAQEATEQGEGAPLPMLPCRESQSSQPPRPPQQPPQPTSPSPGARLSFGNRHVWTGGPQRNTPFDASAQPPEAFEAQEIDQQGEGLRSAIEDVRI